MKLEFPTERSFKRALSKRKEDYELEIFYDETNKAKNDRNKNEDMDR